MSETSSGKPTRLQVNPAAQERQEQVNFFPIAKIIETVSCGDNDLQVRPTHSGCFSRSSPSPTFARSGWNVEWNVTNIFSCNSSGSMFVKSVWLMHNMHMAKDLYSNFICKVLGIFPFPGSIGAVLGAAEWYDALYLTRNGLKIILVSKAVYDRHSSHAAFDVIHNLSCYFDAFKRCTAIGLTPALSNVHLFLLKKKSVENQLQ